jgi:hypothetical protein
MRVHQLIAELGRVDAEYEVVARHKGAELDFDVAWDLDASGVARLTLLDRPKTLEQLIDELLDHNLPDGEPIPPGLWDALLAARGRS